MDEEEARLYFELEVHATTCTTGCSYIYGRRILCYRYYTSPNDYAVAHELPSFSEDDIRRLMRKMNPIEPGEFI